MPNKRNVGLLAVSQGLFQSVQSMGIATSPLAGYALLGEDKSLATLPIFLNHAGIMLTTIPASLLMDRIGRRAGFSIGAILGILFGGLAAYAVFVQSFTLLCVATLIQGSAAAFAWYYRFAAADAAPPDYKAKAISLVMAGGVIAGLVGPQLAKWSVNWFAPVVFAGVYVTIALIGLLSLIVVQFVRIPRLTASERAEGGRPLSEIARSQTFLTALITSMLGYGVMTLLMSSTPLAMQACGFKFEDSATVIQAHVVAMFLPSFFTGHLITRFGTLPIIAAGAIIQTGCAIVNLMGIDFWNFLIANLLVGLGWNFTFVGGSALLTTTYRPAERARVQAAHDFCVYSTTAIAAGLAGFLQQKAGWTVVNIAALPLMAVIVTAAMLLARRQRLEAGLAAPTGKP
ncbi:MAG TPA: MFS transporter [Hyphomicrobiaceae bacterium]|nr:MFS transporter [Hyphomicrobiaceae bacterium]